MASPSYEASLAHLASQGTDTVIEVQVTDAGSHGGSGTNPEARFYLSTRILLIDPHGKGLLFGRDFQYLSGSHLITDWFSQRSQVLMATFTEVVLVLEERILDELFVVSLFPFDSSYRALPGSPEFGFCWFRRIHLELKYISPLDSVSFGSAGIEIRLVKAESFRPFVAIESTTTSFFFPGKDALR